MDWIAARFDCSAEHWWIVLRERIKSDVANWQKRASKDDGRLQVTEEDGCRLVISRSADYGKGPWASLERQKRQFMLSTADDTGTAAHEIRTTLLIPSLNEKGECRLFYEGKELEVWQAARLILEPILFRE